MTSTETTVTESPREKMERKVRALLAQAESTNYPEEAYTFTAKAAEIMAEYGIDSAMISAQENDGKGPEIMSRFVMIRPPYTIDAQMMFTGVALAMRLKVISLGKVGRDRKMHVFGTEADIERFMILWNSLRIQAEGLVMQVEANMFEAAKTARCNFYTGFRHSVVERVTTAETNAEGEAVVGASLVLASQAQAVSDAVSVQYPRLRAASGTVKRSGTASYVAGRAAGNRADIGNKRVTG